MMSRVVRMCGGAALLLGLTLAVGLGRPAWAQTVPIPPDQVWNGPPTAGPAAGVVVWPTGRVDLMHEVDETAAFLDVWQNKVAGPDFGGEIEAESGPLGGVIQTDNTLEAIWVWSHYMIITGRQTYLPDIANAWIYCQNYPPWLEEGGDGYYRVHNCAWALAAESEYRAATADTTFKWFARTSANYIVKTPLTIGQTQKLNAFVEGWAAGNLYLYGQEMSNPGWMTSAVNYGNALLNWVAYNPPVQLELEYWAMSSGTLVWGLCNSVFRDNPSEGKTWVQNYGALVDTFQVWYKVPGDQYNWDNAWNVGYANGHFGMYDVSGDPTYRRHGENLTRQLLSYDTDDDGGIMATTQDPPTEDMSWVSSYLAKFGLCRMLGTPAQRDAGILAFQSPTDGDTLVLGSGPFPVEVLAANFGVQPLTGVSVYLQGPSEARRSSISDSRRSSRCC